VFGAAGLGKLVGRLLPRFASGLSREQRAVFNSLASTRMPAKVPGVPGPHDTLRELDHALAPEITLDGILHEDEGEGGAAGDMLSEMLAEGGGEAVNQLLDELDLPTDAIDRLVPEELHRYEQKFADIASQPPSPKTFRELEKLLDDLGIMEALLE